MRTQTRRLVVGTAAGLALALATPLVPAASAHQGVRGGPESGRHGWHSTSNPATWQARKVLIQSLRAASLALRTQVRAEFKEEPALSARYPHKLIFTDHRRNNHETELVLVDSKFNTGVPDDKFTQRSLSRD